MLDVVSRLWGKFFPPTFFNKNSFHKAGKKVMRLSRQKWMAFFFSSINNPSKVNGGTVFLNLDMKRCLFVWLKTDTIGIWNYPTKSHLFGIHATVLWQFANLLLFIMQFLPFRIETFVILLTKDKINIIQIFYKFFRRDSLSEPLYTEKF